MKILILWPSGIIEQEDGRPVIRRHVWNEYCEDMNRGDLFVYESTLRLLDYSHVEEVPISLHSITEEQYDYYNKNFDFLVIRGSNYIRSDGGLGVWKDFFKRIEIPILAFGIGTQAPTRNEAITLNDDIIEALKIISDKSVSKIGVRGEHSAELLRGLGIDNVEVIGCPSIFRELNRDLKVKFSKSKISSINFTTHPYLGGMYTRDAWQSRIAQLKLMRSMRNDGFKIKFLTQGIAAETRIAYKQDIDAGIKELTDIGWFSSDDPEFVQDFKENSYCFETANDYYKFSATGQINIGVRLHGNITALAMGKPAVFVSYDSRTSELAEYFGIPTLDEDSISDNFNFGEFLSNISFRKFNRNFSKRYDTIKKFLDENKVKHNL
jgi:hypothetical protein